MDTRFLLRRIVISAAVLVAVSIWIGSSWLLGNKERSTTEEQWAVARMKEQTAMTQINRIDRFNGDESWIIVWGIDHVGRPVAGWVNGQQIEVEIAEFLPSHEEIYNRFLQSHPLASVIRVSPARVHGTKTWEVFYKQPTDTGMQYRYAYYKWKTAEAVEEYKLAELK